MNITKPVVPVFLKVMYILLFLVVSYVVLTIDKTSSHLYINALHTPFWDVFFKYTTHLGDGMVFPILVILFFFLQKKTSLHFAISGILTLVFVAFFKKIVFGITPRPIEYIGEANLHLIEGVKMAHWHSFPSGHTTAAFALAIVLISSTPKIYLKCVYFFLAVLAAFSRVYLSQHFLVDILAGSALGISIGLIGLRISDLIWLKIKKKSL